MVADGSSTTMEVARWKPISAVTTTMKPGVAHGATEKGIIMNSLKEQADRKSVV